jgi:hypothetical protein
VKYNSNLGCEFFQTVVQTGNLEYAYCLCVPGKRASHEVRFCNQLRRSGEKWEVYLHISIIVIFISASTYTIIVLLLLPLLLC